MALFAAEVEDGDVVEVAVESGEDVALECGVDVADATPEVEDEDLAASNENAGLLIVPLPRFLRVVMSDGANLKVQFCGGSY